MSTGRLLGIPPLLDELEERMVGERWIMLVQDGMQQSNWVLAITSFKWEIVRKPSLFKHFSVNRDYAIFPGCLVEGHGASRIYHQFNLHPVTVGTQVALVTSWNVGSLPLAEHARSQFRHLKFENSVSAQSDKTCAYHKWAFCDQNSHGGICLATACWVYVLVWLPSQLKRIP